MSQKRENKLLLTKHILLCIPEQLKSISEIYVKEVNNISVNFCGLIFKDIETFINYNEINKSSQLYMCGDINNNYKKIEHIDINGINIITELSHNYENDFKNYKNCKLINLGQVPINIYNVGVHFRNLFDSPNNYFDLISTAHKFQELTESTKPNIAFRTGIYLSKVNKVTEENDELHFNLLRCSSNLNGPTENFREIDNEIINNVKEMAHNFYEEPADLNHVLAQIYENKHVQKNINSSIMVERKAKIKAHSDKTKDMPDNALIAFTTFYKEYNSANKSLKGLKQSAVDNYNYCVNGKSVLTTLRFKLKPMVTNQSLKKTFDVILYPNSVFIISLETNRLYTHEIVPSPLKIEMLPIRMGYVIRCSKTKAVHKNNQTYINENDTLIELKKLNNSNEEIKEIKVNKEIKTVKELKDLYFEENITDKHIHYDKFNFSMNNGDYERPII